MKKLLNKLPVLLIGLLLTSCVNAQEPQYDRFGGWTTIKGKKTGIFHVENIGNKWWIITPEGNVFWSIGVYCVRIGGLPDSMTKKRIYKDNCLQKYGNEQEWARITRLRLHEWGFNTIGDWSTERIYREPGFAYVVGIDLPRKAENVIPKGAYGYFPDVFSQTFKDSITEILEEKFKNQPFLTDDPALLGYFLADEPSWYGSKGRRGALTDDFIALDDSKPGKQAWLSFIQQRYGAEEAKITEKDKLDFLAVVAEQFSKVLYESLKKYDKFHMVLGSRPTRFYPEVVSGIGKYCDIFATSAYDLNQGYTIDPKFDETINDLYKNSQKPILLGVLISGQDVGLPYGIVKSQHDRGISYWRYIAKVASNPAIVGIHWFQYFDPPKHCYDQRAGNWGIVNENDEPYADAITSIAQANKMVYAYALRLTDFSPVFSDKIATKAEPQTSNAPSKTIPLKIVNPGFESRNQSWSLQTWKGGSKGSIDFLQKHSGMFALKIRGSGQGWDSVGVAIQNKPDFQLKPGYQYLLSVWIKTNDVENSAFVRIKVKYANDEEAYFVTDSAYGNNEWKKYEIKFSPREENTVQYLGAQLVGKGTAWFDDIKLELIE